MRNKKILCMFIFVFMIVLSIGAVSAQDADDAVASTNDDVALEEAEPVSSGTVSGGVDVVTENPWNTTGELSYDIPNDAKTIKSADVYVNVYSGSASNGYGANANITITSGNGVYKYNESLWINEGSTDGTVYTVNNHTTKCYSDYMIHYDVTSLLDGLNGSNLKIKVDTFKMDNKSFDGKLKLIGLVLAYDDGDNDVINYWIDDNQLWTKTNVTIPFNTAGKYGLSTLTNVVLSSGDGTYKINGNFLGDSLDHKSGNYYQYNKWDVSDVIDKNKDTSLDVCYAGTSAYGSIKNVLSVLTINEIVSDISLKSEYSSSGALFAFAGTNNTITNTITTNKAGKYVVRLLADGVVVNETEVDLVNGSGNTVLLTDPTIRAVDETTVNGAENKIIKYTVELLFNNQTVSSNSGNFTLRYNGYLGKDLAYPAEGMEPLGPIVINGDIVVETKEAYLSGAGNLNKTDIWTINLGENSTIVKSFVYVPYTWCNPPSIEGPDMFNVTFNGVKIAPINLYRDQSNLGGASGKYGYGVLVYDVTSLINKTGDNTLFLSKNATYPGVYSSALVYMYNTTNSNYIKEVYINQGADILYNSYNNAKRPIKSDSTFVVDSKITSNATLYVFASNAQNNYADLVFNGETNKNIFSTGKSYVTSCYELDVTGKIKDKNSVSVIGANKNTFLALHQILVLTKSFDNADISLTTEYTSVPTAYAGTNNTLTITIDVLKSGKYTVKLLADGQVVDETEMEFVEGTNKLSLTDQTIRTVDESTVNGALNNKVNYTVQLSSGSKSIKNSTFTLPVLYNGYLSKEFAYPAGGMESFLNVTVSGDIVIDVKDVSTYMTGDKKLNRTDVWTINLDGKSSIVKSFVYVPYNWCDPSLTTEDINMFNATFNGEKVVPVAMYRDQGNLGTYGQYGYGVLVYDVTALVNKAGNNSFFLSKAAKYPAVYPSVFIYMYNTTGSGVVKSVYISNGADLLANSYNNAKRIVKADSTINVAVADSAKLYVFAASAQNGEGNIVFNGKIYENVWNGTSSTTDLYTLDITNDVKNSNNISFIATGSTILALQEMIVTTQKAPTTIVASAVTKTYNVNKNLVITLKDKKGKVLDGAKITVMINNVKKTYTTNSNGKVTIAISNLAPKTYYAQISYDGDATHVKSSAKVKIVVKKASVKLTAKAKTFKVKTKTKKYTVTLKNNKNKVMKKVKLTLKVKGKTYKATTNSKGKATFKITKLTKKGKYTATIKYSGSKYYNKLTKKVTIKVKK